jgi:hypothetical protein
MKKSILWITAALVLGTMVLFQACKEDDENTPPANLKIELIAPNANAYVLAPEDLPVVFTWKKSTGTGATTLYISTDEAFPDGAKTLKHEAGDALTYSLGETGYDALLAAGGVDYGDPANVYWKVTADGATPATSSFTAYRAQLPPPPAITLEPTEATLNANALELPLTFAWNISAQGVVDAYTIKFATDATFSAGAVTRDAGNNTTYSFTTATDFDNMLEDLNIVGQGTVYWTVAPTTPNIEVTLPAQPGSFTAVRLSRLITAYDAPAIVPNDYSTGNFTLEWWPSQDVTSYEVVISRNDDLSNPVKSGTVNTTTFSVPWSELQTMIETPANGLKRYKKNTFYWNVKAGDEFIAEAHGRFTLYGQRIFVDNRAALAQQKFTSPGGDHKANAAVLSELPQTYTVAVVEYGGNEVVWMAEDLRATAYFNEWMDDGIGTQFHTIGSTYYVTNDENCTTGTLPTEYLNRTDPPMGLYYDNVWAHDLIPRGSSWDDKVWRVPTETDWRALFNAAYAIDESLNILRHPNFCVGDCGAHVNAWGMNMLGNGAFTYAGNCNNGNTRYEWTEHWFSYLIQTAHETYSGLDWYGNDGYVNGMRNGRNLRAIYTGDGE